MYTRQKIHRNVRKSSIRLPLLITIGMFVCIICLGICGIVYSLVFGFPNSTVPNSSISSQSTIPVSAQPASSVTTVAETNKPPEPGINEIAAQQDLQAQGDTYYMMPDVQKLSLQEFTRVVTERFNQVADLWSITIFLLFILAAMLLDLFDIVDIEKGWWSIPVIVGMIFGYLGYINTVAKIQPTIDTTGQETANYEMTEGFNQARKSQATNLQYFAFTAINNLTIDLICKDTTSAYDWPGTPDDCGQKTGYYYSENVDSKTTYDCTSTDDKGNCEYEWVEHHRVHVVPFFDKVVIYAKEYNTKAKYVLSNTEAYVIFCSNNGVPDNCARDPKTGDITDERNPIITMHRDWRAEAKPTLWTGTDRNRVDYSIVNNHVPASWTEVANAKIACAKDPNSTDCHVVTDYFLGKYFNWALASNSPLFVPYEGPYDSLKTLVNNNLPSPTGTTFQFTDAFGQPASIQTLLYSEDGDLATKMAPVFFIGYDTVPENIKIAAYKKSQEFGGHFGTNKTSILYTFIINDGVVNGLGGLEQTATAVLGLMNDKSRWGLLYAPKNMAISVNSVPSDFSVIKGRFFDTALNIGNTLVKQLIRNSIDPNQPIPFTMENLYGSFHSYYNGTDPIGFTYTPMDEAGGLAGFLYQPDPNWTAPDPKSNDCADVPATHYGYVRPEMCGLQYLETNIQVNAKGMGLILIDVVAKATAVVDVNGAWVLLIIIIICCLGCLYFKGIKDGWIPQF